MAGLQLVQLGLALLRLGLTGLGLVPECVVILGLAWLRLGLVLDWAGLEQTGMGRR